MKEIELYPEDVYNTLLYPSKGFYRVTEKGNSSIQYCLVLTNTVQSFTAEEAREIQEIIKKENKQEGISESLHLKTIALLTDKDMSKV